MTRLESLLEEGLWVSIFSIADPDFWSVGRSLQKTVLDRVQCPDIEHFEEQLEDSSISRCCSHISQRTWLCSSQFVQNLDGWKSSVTSSSGFIAMIQVVSPPRWLNVAEDFHRAPRFLLWYLILTLKKGTPSRNACPMILLTSHSAEGSGTLEWSWLASDSSAPAEFKGVASAKWWRMIPRTETDAISETHKKWGSDRRDETRRCPRMYSLSWGLFERTKCTRS